MELKLELYTSDEMRLAARYLVEMADLRNVTLAAPVAAAIGDGAAFDAPQVEQAQQNEPQVEATKRGRPRKMKDVAIDTEDAQQAVPAATTAAGSALPEAVPAEASAPQAAGEPAQESPASNAPVTIETLRAALQRLTAAQGMPAGIALLQQFGCKRISELAECDDAQKRAFVEACPAAVQEAA